MYPRYCLQRANDMLIVLFPTTPLVGFLFLEHCTALPTTRHPPPTHTHVTAHEYHTDTNTHLTHKHTQNPLKTIPQASLRTTPQTSPTNGDGSKSLRNYLLRFSPLVSTQNQSPHIPQKLSPDIPPNGGGSKSLHNYWHT